MIVAGLEFWLVTGVYLFPLEGECSLIHLGSEWSSGSMFVTFTVWFLAVPAFTLDRYWRRSWWAHLFLTNAVFLKAGAERLAKCKFSLPFPRAGLAPEWLLQCWCLETLCFLFSPLGCSQPLNPPLPLRTGNYYFFHDALLSVCPVDQKELHSPILGGCNGIKVSVFATKHFTFGHDLQG